MTYAATSPELSRAVAVGSMDCALGVEGVMDLKDLRPWGWAICVECGVDCDEDDYDEDRRRSTCKGCYSEQRARQRLSDEDRLALEVFARR